MSVPNLSSKTSRLITKMQNVPGVGIQHSNRSTRIENPYELRGHTALQDMRYKGEPQPKINEKKRKDLLGRGDYTKRLQYLIKHAEYYNKGLRGLQRYPVSRIREAEGMYPELGQYENIENSGWINSPVTSLAKADALSTEDRIAYGHKDRKTGENTIAGDMFHEHASHRLGMERAMEGGDHGPRQKFIQRFSRTLSNHLKDYTELDRLRKRNDPISKLLRTQMENIYNRIDYLTDDKKLQDLTGVDLDESHIKKKLYINRLLPSPLNAEGKKATWALKPDRAVGNVIDPKNSDFFAYTAPYVLHSPLSYFMDKKTRQISAPTEDFLQPFRGMSKLAKNTVMGHQKRMAELCQMNPEFMDPRIRFEYLDNFKLFGKGNLPTAIGTNGLLNFTNMRGDASGGLHEYRPIGTDLIEYYSHGQESKPMDYKPFLAHLFSCQSNRNVISNNNPQPFRPNLPLPKSDLGLKEHYKNLMDN